MLKIITRASECTVGKFMACKFDAKFLVLVEEGSDVPSLQQLAEAWDNIHTEYIDLTGTFLPELKIMKELKVLECKKEILDKLLWAQRLSVTELGEPHFVSFDLIKKNGNHRLKWNNDKDDFLKQVATIERKESNLPVKIAEKEKELANFRKAQAGKETIDNSRVQFLRMLNELQKFGYKIDRDKTYVDELAVMICDYNKLCDTELRDN